MFGKYLLILITVLDLISCEIGYIMSELSGFLFTEFTIKIILNFKNKEEKYIIKETLMYRTVLWTLWERERVGRFGRMALKHVKYHV